MEKVPRQYYTKEYKAEAVRLVSESGLTMPEAGRPVSELKADNTCLRKELADSCLEGEIFKKAITDVACA